MTSLAKTPANRAQANATTSEFNVVLVILAFILVYTELSLWDGEDIIFPNIGGFLVGILAVALNSHRVVRAHIFSLGLIILFAMAATVAAAIWGGTLELDRFRSLAQFAVSLTSAYGIFLATIGSDRRSLSIVFFGIFVIIVAGSWLESLGILSAASDTVRAMLYPRDLIYDSDYRDVVMYGGFRPKFFSREPSLVGISAGFALAAWLLTTQISSNALKIIIVLAASVITMWVVRSPTVLFFAAVAGSGLVLIGSPGPLAKALAKPMFVGAIAIVFFFVPIVSWISQVSGTFLIDILTSGSFLVRLVGPPQVALDVWLSSPVFGFGLGGFEALFDTVRRVYSAQGVFGLHSWLLDQQDARYLLSNAFWEYWIFFGLGGGLLMILLLRRFLLSLGLASTLFPFLAIAISLQTFGGLTTLRVWYFFFTYAAIAIICASSPVPPRKAKPASDAVGARRK